jgi:hypothetical protein
MRDSEQLPSDAEEARRMLDNCDRMIADVNRRRLSRWKEEAGSALADMLVSEDGAGRYLQDHDPTLRRIAVKVLSLHWKNKPGGQFTAVIEGMALGDSDGGVREVALLALGACYRGTDDVRIGRLLARVVRNDAALSLLRRAAYAALHFLRGMKTPLPPPGVGPDALFRIPENVDWSFVDSFLTESYLGPGTLDNP